jgi:DNA-binding NtrC family response regulator
VTNDLDRLDLWMLYDAARGLIGLRDVESILHHTLLALMGACGASSVAYLERDARGDFSLRAARGVAAERPLKVSLSAKAEKALAEARCPISEDVFADLGPAVRGIARTLDARVLLPLTRGVEGRRPGGAATVTGLITIGPRLLGDAYSPAKLELAYELAALGNLALSSAGGAAVKPATADAGPSRTMPGSKRDGVSVQRLDAAEMRRTYPPLRGIQGDGPHTQELFQELLALADFSYPLLIEGETGTGKELAARALHELSSRCGSRFEAINCAAVPPELMMSELFGHERGAFTTAVTKRQGAFERAGSGTIFLDEIGDMPASTQAGLLRVLQERRFHRVGGEQELTTEACVISATNRDLAQEVRAGRFRADLYYRVRMGSIRIAPLRERREELPALVEHLIAHHAKTGTRSPRASRALLDEIARRELRGNVRELESLILGALVRAGNARVLEVEHLPARREGLEGASGPGVEILRTGSAGVGERASDASAHTYEENERAYILDVLRSTGGNKKAAAEIMGIPRTTLNARIKRLGIVWK